MVNLDETDGNFCWWRFENAKTGSVWFNFQTLEQAVQFSQKAKIEKGIYHGFGPFRLATSDDDFEVKNDEWNCVHYDQNGNSL